MGTLVEGIEFKNYKSFTHDSYESLGTASPVNLIIGRNNSGKTSAIDVVEYVFNEEEQKELIETQTLIFKSHSI